MDINSIKGRKFKRNKYGLSCWTDTVKEVHLHWDLENGFHLPRFLVKGEVHVFDIKEIVFIPKYAKMPKCKRVMPLE